MVTIVPIATKKELKEFVRFKLRLYKNNPYAVPPLYSDEIDALLKGRNPAHEIYEYQVFLAKRDGRTVGRVAAIINHINNRTEGIDYVRFGFIDFINDDEVVDALIGAVEEWGRKHGMTHIQGPLGFTDFDPEGMLTQGFERLSTIASIYNYPYYPKQLARLGFKPVAEWVEYLIHVPDTIPEKHKRIAEIVRQKYDLRVLEFKTVSEIIKKGYGLKLFRLINITYNELYGYSQLNEKQMEYYVNKYIPMLRKDLITLIVDREDNLVSFGVALPSLSRAMQKARGRIFPFGFIPLLRALYGKRAEVCDLMLIASHPNTQSMGVTAMLFDDMIPHFHKLGTVYAESNPELENNQRIQALWGNFDKELHKRRAVFAKKID